MRRLFSANVVLLAVSVGSISSTAVAEEPTKTTPWDEPSGGYGVATGFSNGIWGGSLYAQDARIRVPLFSEHFAAQLRGLIVHDWQSADYRLDMGARLGMIGGTAPLLNILRVYGSGGAQFLAPIDNEYEENVKFGLSGEFGVEGFLGPTISIFLEIGGGGYFDSNYGNGGTAMAGLQFYPF